MKLKTMKTVSVIKTAGDIRTAYTGAETWPFFSGAKMIALMGNRESENRVVYKKIKYVTNNLRFHNQIVVRISLFHTAKHGKGSTYPHERGIEVKDYARDLLDLALRREIDSEIAVMSRGENVASNQRRQKMLGKYLLSKPHHVIKNFYGVQMQKIVTSLPEETHREGNDFYSDIIHERVDKTVYSPIQTQIESVTAPPAAAAISDGDLNRIAAQAARQVERKMKTERERNGKW